ncbi:MAG: DUF2281 domain-containing protein [Thermodesulfobacteriota bacterium]
MTRLEKLIKELPPDLQKEAEDFLEFLLTKKIRKPPGALKLDWRGALRHLRDQYTSVELQHKAQEWWGD